MLSAPSINFPIDEVNLRINYLREKTIHLINLARENQSKLSYRNSLSDEEEKSLIDKVDTIFDSEISKILKEKFPHDSFHFESTGEETGKSDFKWIVDSIDGTMNFLRKIPLYAISMGLEYRGSTVGAYVILPDFNDVYLSIRGEGAFRNGVSIECSEIQNLDRSLLISSFPYSRKSNMRETISEVSAFVSTGRSMRRTGSLVVDLCWLAEGRVDGLWEKDVKKFDISATSLILEEAGGNITNLLGQEIINFPTGIIASNGYIQPQIIEVLKKTRNELNLN
ncbi:MAG: inositol monophosphatase [Leptospiraceae bacterium]|nr:inositol monophosphatase [Leptospiraceae bacterium]MCP5512965.1 inositol monophosphatase [Leptospiraceae bacterium]